MEIVAQEEVIITTTTAAAASATSIDQTTLIVKGKRTKRLRPQSPMPFAIPAATATAEHSSASASASPSPSPDTSGANEQDQEREEEEEEEEAITASGMDEEEDMANCLIMLAQGGRGGPANTPSPPLQPMTTPAEDHGGGGQKFSSRKLLVEAATSGSGKGGAGNYVYECKTCNRTFLSFQALGGHRASHKKPPKANTIADINNNTHLNVNNNKKIINSASTTTVTNTHALFGLLPNNNNNNSDQEKDHNLHATQLPSPSPQFKALSALSLQLARTNTAANNSRGNHYLYGPVGSSTNNNNSSNHNKSSSASSNKVHECSICGAEFTSGQALGGHMRRHRSAPAVGPAAAAAATATALSLGSNNTIVNSVPIAATPLRVALEKELVNGDDRDEEDENGGGRRKRARSVLSLDLDLNLPAPPETEGDQHRESKFGFVNPKQQPQQQQFSAPALVDCHY